MSLLLNKELYATLCCRTHYMNGELMEQVTIRGEMLHMLRWRGG